MHRIWLLVWVLGWMGASLLPVEVRAQGAPGSDATPAVGATAGVIDAPNGEHIPIRYDSPRATMFTFLAAINRAHAKSGAERLAAYQVARTCLDTQGVELDGVQLRDRMDMLKALLDRLGTIHPEDLPDETEVARETLRQFVFFPRHPVHDWLWEKLPTPPTGRIALARDPDGHWRFTADTLTGLTALYQQLIKLPNRHEGGNELINLVTPTWERTTVTGWLMLLAAIFSGLLLGKLAQMTFRGLGDRAEQRLWLRRATILRNIASPASLAILTFGLAVGFQFIYLESPVFLFALRIIKFLYILALAWFLYNLVDLLDLYLRELTAKTESKLDDMLVPLIRKTLRIFLIIIFTLVVAQNVFGLNITGWLAGLGIAGLAISLAAQDSVKNLFGSVTVFFDQPFIVGDRIIFDGADGTVEEIGFRSTKIRTLTGHVVTIPNMKFIDNRVENITRRPFLRRTLDITVTYDTSPEKVQQAVDIVKNLLADPEFAHAFDLQTLPPRVYFNEYNAASLNIRVMYWYTLKDGRDWWSYNDHAEKFNLRLLRAFNAAGIDFAFPTQTLYLAGDPKRPLGKLAAD